MGYITNLLLGLQNLPLLSTHRTSSIPAENLKRDARGAKEIPTDKKTSFLFFR